MMRQRRVMTWTWNGEWKHAETPAAEAVQQPSKAVLIPLDETVCSTVPATLPSANTHLPGQAKCAKRTEHCLSAPDTNNKKTAYPQYNDNVKPKAPFQHCEPHDPTNNEA